MRLIAESMLSRGRVDSVIEECSRLRRAAGRQGARQTGQPLPLERWKSNPALLLKRACSSGVHKIGSVPPPMQQGSSSVNAYMTHRESQGTFLQVNALSVWTRRQHYTTNTHCVTRAWPLSFDLVASGGALPGCRHAARAPRRLQVGSAHFSVQLRDPDTPRSHACLSGSNPHTRRYHVYCSARNVGAAALMLECSDQLGLKVIVSEDAAEVLACERMLVYLTSSTWTRGESSSVFAEEVRSAMASGVPLLLCHEMPGVGGQEERGACDFDTLFSNAKGATPQYLLQLNIYAQIATPLKGGAWRHVSMVMVAQGLVKRAERHRQPMWPSPLEPEAYSNYIVDWRGGVSPSRRGGTIPKPPRRGPFRLWPFRRPPPNKRPMMRMHTSAVASEKLPSPLPTRHSFTKPSSPKRGRRAGFTKAPGSRAAADAVEMRGGMMTTRL
jgi:hypothetical protein